MKAVAVIGANYGDEGKGLTVDWLVRKLESNLVVRHNGGAQAGHTVIDGNRRHVFSHFGAGMFAGAGTYLSEHFVCNPILFERELRILQLGARVGPLWIHPESMITTPWDMLINQAVERARGADRHGSCGVGFGETVGRCETRVPLRARDLLWKSVTAVGDEMEAWADERCAQLGLPPVEVTDQMFMDFLSGCGLLQLIGQISTSIVWRGPVIFEGAQGLCLDAERGDFPHVTRSRTGVRNAADVAAKMGLDLEDVWYVTRSYLTRHGAGRLPGECFDAWTKLVKDDTNLHGAWQGPLRLAPIWAPALKDRIVTDFEDAPRKATAKLMVTCLDQVGIPGTGFEKHIGIETGARSFGPRATDVAERRQ